MQRPNLSSFNSNCARFDILCLNLKSKASRLISLSLISTIHCVIKGSFSLASLPKTSSITGTFLQPQEFNPKDSASCSHIFFAKSLFFKSLGMKIIPIPDDLGSHCSAISQTFLKYGHGISHKIPAPSPESLSPPQPHLCSIQLRPRKA